ncbi:alpha/beta hydrolase [Agilicoccus flavus]|uniref:alpha/beta hydrolase n=1 Tax=Agilicoccus flavus TaxID=2775968 RepID=UPI001CF6FDE1|nr:alpha/beta hydrolase [Agilicoccus flavus]
MSRAVGRAVLTGLLLAPAVLSACASGPPPLTPEQVRSAHPTPPTPEPTVVPATHLLDRAYVAGGDEAQKLDLTVPGGYRGPRPVVVFIHGGAWKEGDRGSFERRDGTNFAALRTRLLEQGWATASIGYRFTDVARMPAQLHDAKAAVRWLYAHAGRYGLDRDRIAVVGESAGGHLAQLVGDTRGDAAAEGTLGVTNGAKSDVVAVVSYYGVADLRRLVADRVAAGCGTGDAGRASPEGRLIGADPAAPAAARAADAASPIGHVSPSSAPTFFLHGRRDCVVPAAQSRRAAQALTSAGVPAQVETIDAGHADPRFFTTPALQDRVVDFLTRYLGAPDRTADPTT